MTRKFTRPTKREIRNPWINKPKGKGARFPAEWHMRTKKERALGRAIFGCETVKDLALRLKLVYQRYPD